MGARAEVVEALSNLGRRIDADLDALLRTRGIDLVSAIVLEHAARRPGMNQQMLGAVAGMSPRKIVLTLDLLEAKGLARREPSPHDRRSHAIWVTTAGRRAVERLAEDRRRLAEQVLTGLTPAERDVLGATLLRIGGRPSAAAQANDAGGSRQGPAMWPPSTTNSAPVQ
jgi:DNA-binding MarR family transcriptional regulator